MKTCKKCLEVLPMDRFYSRKDSLDGKYHCCILCMKKDMKEYRSKPEAKQEALGRWKKWRVNNKEDFAKHNRKASKKNSLSLNDSYIIKRIKGNKSSVLKNSDIRMHPQLIEACRVNLKIKRLLNDKK
jgi:hypothetical protein